MKSKIILLSLLFSNLALGAHTTDRKIYATDITKADGTSILKVPTSAPTANRVLITNTDGELTSSSVTDTDLSFVFGGLTNQQLLFGNGSGGVSQNSNLTWDSTNAALLLGTPSQTSGSVTADPSILSIGQFSFIGGNVTTNDTRKFTRFAGLPFSDEFKPVMAFIVDSVSDASPALYIGSSSSLASSPADIYIQTSNGDVTSGTPSSAQRMRFNRTGEISIGTDAPVSNQKLTINTNAAAAKGLVVKGATSQTANLLELQDSAAASKYSVNPSGVSTQSGGATFGGTIGASGWDLTTGAVGGPVFRLGLQISDTLTTSYDTGSSTWTISAGGAGINIVSPVLTNANLAGDTAGGGWNIYNDGSASFGGGGPLQWSSSGALTAGSVSASSMSSESFEANYGGNPGLWINPSYASGDSPAGINTVTGVGSFSQLEVGGYGVTVLDSSGGASFMSGDVTISSSAYSIGNNGINIDNAGVIASGSHGSQWSIDAGGIAYLKKISSAGNIPVVSSCGTSPGISGTDMSGTVTVGTGGTATSCTVTFDIAYANTPHCFVNDQTDTVTPRVSAVSTTAFTITKLTAFTAGAVIDYFCVQ